MLLEQIDPEEVPDLAMPSSANADRHPWSFSLITPSLKEGMFAKDRAGKPQIRKTVGRTT